MEVVVQGGIRGSQLISCFCRAAGGNQASRSLKYIISESIQRVTGSLNRHLSEGAVTQRQRVQALSVLTA